jgi:hypothetical protein
MIIALSYLLFSIHFSLITKVSLTIKKLIVKRITDTQIKTDHTDRNILLLIFFKERVIYLQSPRLIWSNEGGDFNELAQGLCYRVCALGSGHNCGGAI